MRGAGNRLPKALMGGIGAATLLLTVATPPFPAHAELDQPAPGSTIKRLAPPKGGGIGGLEGFIGHSTARGEAAVRGPRQSRFNYVVIQGPEGQTLRVITLSPEPGTPPLPRRRPASEARIKLAALGGALGSGLAGAGPTRLRPGMRPLYWPLEGAFVSSGYGSRIHPVLGGKRLHYGVDLPAPRGAPVHAAADGIVRYRGRNGGYGRFIRIDHGFGLETAYGHLRRYALGLRRDVRVRRGEVIGYVGSSGLSTGPHLHYEVRINGRAIDPLGVMPAVPRRLHLR